MSGGSRAAGPPNAGSPTGGGPATPAPRPLLHRPQSTAGRILEAVAAPLRNFSCTHYDDCLDHAVHAGWPSWTCDGCEAFLEAPSDRLAHDVAGLLQIWSEATGESVIDGPGGTGPRTRHSIRGVPR
jgi:hypothetical protein